PGAPLRPGRARRGDDRGAPAGRRLRQGALPRLQRVDDRADPGRARRRGTRPVRLLAAAVLDAVAGARGRTVPALGGQRDLADLLVAARPGVLPGKYRSGEAPPTDSRAASSDMNLAMDLVLSDRTLEA